MAEFDEPAAISAPHEWPEEKDIPRRDPEIRCCLGCFELVRPADTAKCGCGGKGPFGWGVES